MTEMTSMELAEDRARSMCETIRDIFNGTGEYTNDDGDVIGIYDYLDDKLNCLGKMTATVDVFEMKDPTEFSLLIGYGGPNVYLTLDQGGAEIEVYWGAHCREFLCSVNDPLYDKLYRWFISEWKDALRNC